MVPLLLLGLLASALSQDLFLSMETRPLEYHHRNPGFFDSDLVLADRTAANAKERHRHARRLQRAAQETLGRAGPPETAVSPVSFGADPTGVRSSSDAFDAAVKALLSLRRTRDLLGLYDLGGATLDLAGGAYLIDRPVAFPALYANFKVTRGSLIASANFPAHEYMLKVGGQGCDEHKDGGCNRNVDISHMTLDGRSVAFGGLIVNHTMDVNIGPAMYITSWRWVGISLAGSGAGQVHQAWLGEIPPGSPVSRTAANGTAILLASAEHDAQISDIIIFSGRTGVVSVNGANRLQGVHAWNLRGSEGGVGIELGNPWGGPSGGQVQNSYLDFAPLVIVNPGNCLVTGNLFLGTSAIVLKARRKYAIRNLIITSNTHHAGKAGNHTIELDESGGSFTSILDTVVENNEVDKTDAALGKKGTRATRSVVLECGARGHHFDFTGDLVFKTRIDEASVRCWLYGPHATLMTTILTDDLTVAAKLAEPVPCGVHVRLTCEVDQSARACPAH